MVKRSLGSTVNFEFIKQPACDISFHLEMKDYRQGVQIINHPVICSLFKRNVKIRRNTLCNISLYSESISAYHIYHRVLKAYASFKVLALSVSGFKNSLSYTV